MCLGKDMHTRSLYLYINALCVKSGDNICIFYNNIMSDLIYVI